MERDGFILRIILTHECSYMGFSLMRSLASIIQKPILGTRECQYITQYKTNEFNILSIC